MFDLGISFLVFKTQLRRKDCKEVSKVLIMKEDLIGFGISLPERQRIH